MKKNFFKSAFAIACIAVASVSGFKAYDQHNKNVAATNMLLAENVEALSAGDGWGAVGSFLAGFFGGGDSSKEEKWYRADCNDPCQFYKHVNGRDELVNGTKKGCCDTKAVTAGCTIPNYNPCHQ